MPVHDVGMVMLEELVHLLHLLRGEGLDDVHPVRGEVEVRSTVALMQKKKSTTAISTALSAATEVCFEGIT